MTRFRHYLNALLLICIALFICNVAYAALYNIVNTDDFVNGVPSTLTTKERAKLVTTTITKTEASCLAGKCKLLDKATAKTKIKAIIASEVCVAPQTGTWPNCVTPPVCPQYTTGTPPNCIPIPCGQGFTGNQPNCTPIVVPPSSLMPFVDLTKNMLPAAGYNSLRIRPTSEQPANKDGSFRIVCAPSHMNKDDPLVYPGQKDRAHHHTYYGNTNVKFDTNLDTLSTVGNSTCNGGIMNRSAYWHPTMIDSRDGSPVLPDGGAIFYYKSSYGIATSLIKPPPKGLRMIAGNMHATNSAEAQATKFVCINIARQDSNGMPWQKTIPNCGTDTYMQMVVEFPNCWDGKNLDSPNHKDHMAYSGIFNGKWSCPTSHPVLIPLISLNLNYKVHYTGQMSKWRLSSDNYTYTGTNAGYSGHADWVNGWSDGFTDTFVKFCLNATKDCHAHLLGDGRLFE
jgi:hypothetical protein